MFVFVKLTNMAGETKKVFMTAALSQLLFLCFRFMNENATVCKLSFLTCFI